MGISWLHCERLAAPAPLCSALVRPGAEAATAPKFQWRARGSKWYSRRLWGRGEWSPLIGLISSSPRTPSGVTFVGVLATLPRQLVEGAQAGGALAELGVHAGLWEWEREGEGIPPLLVLEGRADTRGRICHVKGLAWEVGGGSSSMAELFLGPRGL